MPEVPAALTGLDAARLNELGQRLADQVHDIGIDGKGPTKGATQVADENLASYGGDPERAIRKLITTHVRRCGPSSRWTAATS